MTEIKQKALDKMLVEMKDNKSPAIDVIHNWLCEQEDDVLFSCVLKEGKTITEALGYCADKAKKEAVKNCAMVDDKTVFGWVKDYFFAKEVKVDKTPVKVATAKVEKTDEELDADAKERKEGLSKSNTKHEKSNKTEQLSLLFDL